MPCHMSRPIEAIGGAIDILGLFCYNKSMNIPQLHHSHLLPKYVG